MNLKMGVTRKQSTANFSKNKHLPPDTHTYVCVSGVRNVLFLENLVWRVVLLPYSRRGFYPMHFYFSYFLFPFLTILWLCCIMHFRVLLPRSPLEQNHDHFLSFLAKWRFTIWTLLHQKCIHWMLWQPNSFCDSGREFWKQHASIFTWKMRPVTFAILSVCCSVFFCFALKYF